MPQLISNFQSPISNRSGIQDFALNFPLPLPRPGRAWFPPENLSRNIQQIPSIPLFVGSLALGSAVHRRHGIHLVASVQSTRPLQQACCLCPKPGRLIRFAALDSGAANQQRRLQEGIIKLLHHTSTSTSTLSSTSTPNPNSLFQPPTSNLLSIDSSIPTPDFRFDHDPSSRIPDTASAAPSPIITVLK